MPGFSVGNLTGNCSYIDGSVDLAAGYVGPSNTIETARKNRYKLAGIINGGPQNSNTISSGTGIGIGGTTTSTFLDATGFLLYAYKCTRPSVEYKTIEIHNGAEQISRPGKVSYGSVEFTFYEIMESSTTAEGGYSGGSAPPPIVIVKSVSNFLYKWHSKIMYDRIGAMLHKPEEFLANIDLELLDGAGNSTYRYRMYDCWPSKVTPSDLSYIDGEISDVSVVIQLNKYIEGPIGDFPE